MSCENCLGKLKENRDLPRATVEHNLQCRVGIQEYVRRRRRVVVGSEVSGGGLPGALDAEATKDAK
jgi:hypothetical protein